MRTPRGGSDPSTESPGAPHEIDNAQLAEALAWLGPAFARWTAGLLPHEETTYARARVLAVLQRQGPQIMARVRNDLGLSAPAMTALIDALEQDGMIQRQPHPTDRRATVLELTTAGRACDLADRYSRAAGDLFDGLPLDEREALSNTLSVLAGRLRQRMGGDN